MATLLELFRVPMRLSISVVLCLLLVSLTIPAWAQRAPVSEARRAELHQQYKEGVALYEASRYADALPKLQEVADELDSPNALLDVGRCLHKMGRHVEAYDTMVRCVALATERAKTEPRYTPTIQAAKDELPELEKHVGRVRVSILSAVPEGAVLDVGGRAVRIDAVVAVEPGMVRIELRAPGHQTARRQIAAVAGQRLDVALDLVPAPAPAPTPAPAAAAPTPLSVPVTPPPSRGGVVRILGFAVLGVGVVGWAALIAGGVVSDAKFEDLEQRCADSGCTPLDDTDRELIDSGRTFEIVANAGIAVGIAGTVAGTLMIVFGGPSDVSAPVTGGMGPGGGFIAYTGQF
jgi:hypothetical protein